jgi:hypothetical protein
MDWSRSSLGTDVSTKAFNDSMDNTRHVIVFGTFKFWIPDLEQKQMNREVNPNNEKECVKKTNKKERKKTEKL